MEEELRALLRADPSVYALNAGRSHWGARPQGDPLPALVLNVVSGGEGTTLSGPDGLEVARVQIDAWAVSLGDAVRLGRAVQALLNGYRGGGFSGVFLESRRGPARDGGSNEATRPWRVSLDFMTNWRVST